MTAPSPCHIYYPPAFGDFGRSYRYRIWYGGRGGAKSWTVATALVVMAATRRLRILCCREFQNSIADSSKKLIADKIEALGLARFFHITDTSIRSTAGSEFIFKGLARNEQSIKSTEGIDICWVEEAQTTSARSLELLIPTIRKDEVPGGATSEIWFTLNPNLESDPVYKFMQELKGDSDALIRKVNYDDNPWFPKTLEAERLRLLRNDPELYVHVWGGECRTISESLIFNRKYEVREFETPANVRFFHGVDWGFASDPTALIRSYIADETLYIDAEAYGYHVELDAMDEFFKRIDTTANWPIKADNSRPETIAFMARRGYDIAGAEKWSGSVEDGITYLRGFKRIVIHPRCENTIREFGLYSYVVDKRSGDILPKVQDLNNHTVDGIRYSLDGYIRSDDWTSLYERLDG